MDMVRSAYSGGGGIIWVICVLFIVIFIASCVMAVLTIIDAVYAYRNEQRSDILILAIAGPVSWLLGIGMLVMPITTVVAQKMLGHEQKYKISLAISIGYACAIILLLVLFVIGIYHLVTTWS